MTYQPGERIWVNHPLFGTGSRAATVIEDGAHLRVRYDGMRQCYFVNRTITEPIVAAAETKEEHDD